MAASDNGAVSNAGTYPRPRHLLSTFLCVFVALALTLQHWVLGDYDSLDNQSQASQTWVPRIVFGAAWACAAVALAAHISRGCLSRGTRPLTNRSNRRLRNGNSQIGSEKSDIISLPVHSSSSQVHSLAEDLSPHIPSNHNQSIRASTSTVHARKNAQQGWMIASMVLLVSAVAMIAFVALSLAGVVLTAQHFQLPFKAFGEGLTRACLATAFGLVALILLVLDTSLYIGAFKTAGHTTSDSSTTHTHLDVAALNILQMQPPADLMLAEDVVLTALFCTLIILINVASFIFMNLEDGWSFRSAEQWYISSVTTLGFGQVHVLKPVSKYSLLFSSTLGIILLASILATIASKLISIIRKFLLRGIRKVRKKAAARKKRFAKRKIRRAEEHARLREQEALRRFNELEALVNSPDSTSLDGAESQWTHGATWHGTSENGKFLAQFGKQLAAHRRALADQSKSNSILHGPTPSRIGSPTDFRRTYSSAVAETFVMVEPSSSPHPPPRSIPRSLSVTAFPIPSSQSPHDEFKLSNALPLTSASTSRLKYPGSSNPAPGTHNLQAASYESLSNLNTDFGVPLTRITTMDSTTEAAHELGYAIDDSDQNDQDNEMRYNFRKLQKAQHAHRRRLDRKKVQQMTREFQIRKRKSGALAFEHWKRADIISDDRLNSSGLNPNNESQQTMRSSRRRKPRSSIQPMMQHKQNSAESGTENELEFVESTADVENTSSTEDEGEETPHQQGSHHHRSSFASADSSSRRHGRKKKFSVSRQLLRIHSWLESQADAVALAILIPLVLFGGALLFMLAESPDWDYVESLYFNYSLITTTGYGDIYPKSGWGRTLVIVMVFLGLGLWAYAVSSVVARLQAEEVDDMAQYIHAERVARKQRNGSNENLKI
ncbi:hypothetical protein BJ741DRAFT_606388, partial [Chytriomyces cf. hyalinus JEL632]